MVLRSTHAAVTHPEEIVGDSFSEPVGLGKDVSDGESVFKAKLHRFGAGRVVSRPLGETRSCPVGEKVRERRGFYETRGRVVLPDGTVAADGTAMYAPVPDATLAEMAAGYPRLGTEWMVGGG